MRNFFAKRIGAGDQIGTSAWCAAKDWIQAERI